MKAEPATIRGTPTEDELEVCRALADRPPEDVVVGGEPQGPVPWPDLAGFGSAVDAWFAYYLGRVAPWMEDMRMLEVQAAGVVMGNARPQGTPWVLPRGSLPGAAGMPLGILWVRLQSSAAQVRLLDTTCGGLPPAGPAMPASIVQCCSVVLERCVMFGLALCKLTREVREGRRAGVVTPAEFGDVFLTVGVFISELYGLRRGQEGWSLDDRAFGPTVAWMLANLASSPASRETLAAFNRQRFTLSMVLAMLAPVVPP